MPDASSAASVCRMAKETRACGMASEASSSVTASANRAAASVRASVNAWPRTESSARSPSRSAVSSEIRSSSPSSSVSRPAFSWAQASTAVMSSPYFRVRAVSAARRSSTTASRSGSASS